MSLEAEEALRLLTRIHEWTRKRKLDWTPTGEPERFRCSVSNKSFAIEPAGAGFSLDLMLGSGEVISTHFSSEMEPFQTGPKSVQAMMEEIFTAAGGTAQDIDAVLDAVFEDLREPQKA
jgi:hypothetical protein